MVDTTAFGDRDNKLDGEIVNIVRDEKHWRKQTYWFVHFTSRDTLSVLMVRYRPSEFVKKSTYPEDSEDEKSTVGKLPPSDSEEE